VLVVVLARDIRVERSVFSSFLSRCPVVPESCLSSAALCS
jgi:hypothetical protein